jgi:hypothetical protein
MPLALSLHTGLGPWIRGPLDVQDSYRSFLDRQAEVIARARGAFLSRWFGPLLPLEGLSVQVALANLAALVARARSVSVTGRLSPWDQPNLTEPLAGLAGITAGMWASPFNSLLLGAMVADAFPRWWIILLSGLNAITAGAVGMAVLFIGGAGVGGLLALTGLAGRDVPSLVGLLGSVALLAGPATVFWGQLTGPRTEVRNPVLRELLAVLDSLAQLMPHLVGAMAIVITGALPQVPVLTALAGYGRACGDVVYDAINGMVVTLRSLAGPKSPVASIRRVLGVVGNLLMQFAGLLQAGWSYLGVAAITIGSQASAALSTWKASILPGLGAILSPVLNPLKAASQAFSAVASILGRAFGGPPGLPMRAARSGARAAAQAAAPAIKIARLLMGPPSPPVPPTPSLAGFGAILAPLQQPPAAPEHPPGVPLDLEAALDRLAQPPHMLGDVLAKPTRRRPKGEDRRPAATPVGDLATYLEMARRVVPPVLAEPFADLQHRLRDLPVRAAPPTQELRVQVGALRVRVPDAQAATGRAWSIRLRRAMEMHVVRVPAAARAAAAGAPGAR